MSDNGNVYKKGYGNDKGNDNGEITVRLRKW